MREIRVAPRLVAAAMVVACAVGAAWSAMPRGGLAPFAREIRVCGIVANFEPLDWPAWIVLESAELFETGVTRGAWVEYGSAVVHLLHYGQLMSLWI